jgi:hypothetical protein
LDRDKVVFGKYLHIVPASTSVIYKVLILHNAIRLSNLREIFYATEFNIVVYSIDFVEYDRLYGGAPSATYGVL